MSFLKTLPRDQRILLTGLPYRVGAWISQTDMDGGWDADLRERQVLGNILIGFTQDVFGSEAVQHIMAETLAQTDKWAEWAGSPGTVLADCRLAVRLLSEHVEEKEVKAYRQRLLEIAEAVALAFREEQGGGLRQKILTIAEYYSDWFAAMAKRQSFVTLERYKNISRREREALRELTHVLEL